MCQMAVGADHLRAVRLPSPASCRPYLLSIMVVIARDRISLRPAVAQVVHFAETEAAQGAGLIELAQQAIDEGRLGDEDIEQLEQLDAKTQLIGESELALIRRWRAGAKPRD